MPKKEPSTKKIAPPLKKVQFIEPMQCKPVSKLPEGEEWHYELKLDGYRCIVVKRSDVQLVSRNGKSLNSRFPQLVEALSDLPSETAVLDGEVVILDEQGRPSFQLLQNSATATAPVYFYAFDVLQHEGEDLVAQPLEQRRGALESLLAEVRDPIRFSVELQGSADEVVKAVAQLGLEGVVAKRRDSVYEAGQRSGAWVKFRTNNAQEFVIGGYIPGTKDFDALLVGYYSGKDLLYAAKVKRGHEVSARRGNDWFLGAPCAASFSLPSSTAESAWNSALRSASQGPR